jgi:hypothetical protein
VSQLEELLFDEKLERTWIYPLLPCAGYHMSRFVSYVLPDGPLNVAGDTSKERTNVKFSDVGTRLKTSTAPLDFATVNFGYWF